MAVPLIPNQEQSYDLSTDDQIEFEGVRTIYPIISNNGFNPARVKRVEVLDFGNTGFLLQNVMTPPECLQYIQEGQRIGFGPISGASQTYRDQQRILFRSPDLAQLLWDRIKDRIEDITIDGDPAQHHVWGITSQLQGKWMPTGLNELFRLCKYEPGGHFAPHYDGHFAMNSQERSLKTYMVYLNSDFKGGSTNFIDDSQELYVDEDGRYCAEDKNILCELKPETGMVIIFNHHRLHEGATLRSGRKYILRTDIMYRRCDEGIPTDPKEDEAVRLLQEAERLEALGEGMEAAECYRKAFKMSPSLANDFSS